MSTFEIPDFSAAELQLAFQRLTPRVSHLELKHHVDYGTKCVDDTFESFRAALILGDLHVLRVITGWTDARCDDCGASIRDRLTGFQNGHSIFRPDRCLCSDCAHDRRCHDEDFVIESTDELEVY